MNELSTLLQQPPRCNADVVSDAYNLGKILARTDEQKLVTLIQVAKELRLDAYNIGLLELLLAATQMFHSLGLASEGTKRIAFYETSAEKGE